MCPSSGDQESKIKVLARLVPSKGYEGKVCRGHITALSLSLARSPSMCGCVSRFPLCMRMPVILDYRFALLQHEPIFHIGKNSISKEGHLLILEVGTLIYEWGRGTQFNP